MQIGQPLRVLHGLTGVGGNPQALARAERSIGLSSWCVVSKQSIFQYPADEIMLKPGDGQLVHVFKKLRIFIRMIFNCDVIHLNFGSTIITARLLFSDIRKKHGILQKLNFIFRWIFGLLEFWDLKLLKALGKQIYITFQGDDARQGDYCLKNFPIHFASVVGESYFTNESDNLKRWRIKQFDKYCDGLFYLNPDLKYVLPSRSEFLPYASVDFRTWKRTAPRVNVSDKPLRVIHAPSHRHVKGTEFVLQAVEYARQQGLVFEFILVEGLSNSEARKLYETADIAIDQLLAGWYGALAVELMALEIPVICYIRPEDLQFIPSEMAKDLPLINAEPSSISKVLLELLKLPREDINRIGARSRDFVEKWHDPVKIAEFLKSVYVRNLKT